MFEILLILLLSQFLLFSFYLLFKSNWPNIYFASTDSISPVISQSPARFLVFRLMPPLLINTWSVTVINMNAHLNENTIFLLSVVNLVIYWLFNNGRSLSELLLHYGNVKRFINIHSQIFYHCVVLVCFIIISFISSIFVKNGYFDKLVPTIPGLVDNIWSSIITAVLLLNLYKLYESQSTSDISPFIKKSLLSIDKKIVKTIKTESLKNHANWKLVLAICVVENIQRPSWIRKMEKLTSLFKQNGSYGIMQIRTEKHLSDEDSIKLAVAAYFKETEGVGSENYDKFKEIVNSYNPSSDYFDLVYRAYYIIK